MWKAYVDFRNLPEDHRTSAPHNCTKNGKKSLPSDQHFGEATTPVLCCGRSFSTSITSFSPEYIDINCKVHYSKNWELFEFRDNSHGVTHYISQSFCNRLSTQDNEEVTMRYLKGLTKLFVLIGSHILFEFKQALAQKCEKINDCSCRKSNGKIISLEDVDGGSKGPA